MVRQQVSLNDLALLLPRQCAKYFITSSFFWLSPSHGGCYARTERSNLFWSHWSNQGLKSELLSRQPAPVSPLAARLMDLPASVANKRFTAALSSATFGLSLPPCSPRT